MRWSSVLEALVLLTTPASFGWGAMSDSPGLVESARQLAARAAGIIRQTGGRQTVAVFPFSDSKGQVTAEMGDVPAFYQGEIIYTLTELLGDRFLVLDKAMLLRRFKDRGVSPLGIDRSTPKRTGEVLRQVGVDMAILGSFDGLGRDAPVGEVQVTAGVYFASGKMRQLTARTDPDEIHLYTPGNGGVPRFEKNRRLKVEVLVDGRPLPLFQCQNTKSRFCGELFLIVPRLYLGREYQIRLTNNGSPPIESVHKVIAKGVYVETKYESDYDQERLIGVALFVDGVNTIFSKDANGAFVPVSRPPDRVWRWLLAPPGYLLERADQKERWSNGGLRINDGRLVRTNGPDHSVLTVRGFQADDTMARAFVFCEAGDSFAEAIGITKEIGIISVYVFPEEVPEERTLNTTWVKSNGQLRPVHEMGTRLGRPLASDVQGFQVQLAEGFRQVWRIHYRLEGDPLPVSRSDLVPFDQ